ncbi:Homeobox domain-containing protein [Fusarium falciforme]|uniref:Homeobox domain-containing protein n=1 Tax=Fusarium falciforme TaxID=195108 RepID=UPI00230052D3|nr:Homeobox domain-containing protein [Fusarium falciforme]WAO93901.1 Homeobox domain-containing protein [Fusarium falciforme]
MLVTRQYDTEHSHWPFSKYDPSRNPASPRMSNPYDVHVELPAPSSWQGQHSGTAHSGNGLAQPFGQRSDETQPAQSRQPAGGRGNALGIHVRPETNQIHAPASIMTDQRGLPSEVRHSNLQDGGYGARFSTSARENLITAESGKAQAGKTNSLKDDDEDDLDEEDMLDGEGDNPAQTAAERAAARRKMKRFRLTHQQTRFLMSEFAKQPHPDAAHRERLSREIPGLSPRQVQVWFQNRRAKIKRLNADDRDRMIKMRAVPEGFDNVQALHSPYGAVHGMNTPLSAPGQFNTQSYAQHMMRPLIVDVRRTEASEHASPTSLTPGFGGLGYSPAGSMNSPSIVSPLSPASSDRYAYGGHFSAPLTASPRTSHPFGQHGLDAPIEINRPSPHPIQPPLLRDTMSRARSESSQSPLRSTMSWKGDTIDYSYRGANTSPSLADRHTPLYQPAPITQPSGGMDTYAVNSMPGSRASPVPQAPSREVERA